MRGLRTRSRRRSCARRSGVAYDPAAATLIDEAHAAGETPELSWHDVGPTYAEATYDGYLHDSAVSVTWGMSTAPRGTVQSGVLAKLLAPHRDIARKRVTLLYRPVDAARAAAIVRGPTCGRRSSARPRARSRRPATCSRPGPRPRPRARRPPGRAC
ncbi:SCO6880 family protein [Georgenia soli]|uniref:SCO6880 family protein n=1 Tax=Georgenia soli TaxID=638953 RepID=UPI0031830D8B